MANTPLLEALDDLDAKLVKHQLHLDIFICGAMAIQLHGFDRVEPTYDVDTVTPIHNKAVLEIIVSVGTTHGLQPKWLNDQSSTIEIPEGAFERAKRIDRWKSIRAVLMDRADLIKMKAAAFSTRRDETLKDMDDLILMNPTIAEINAAINYVKKTRSPPQGAAKKMIEEFNETIADLKKLNSAN